MNSVTTNRRASSQSPADEKHGLLLVGHGTRDATGRDEFMATATSVARRLSHMAVQPCFLELSEPTIAQAVDRLAERGIDRLSVMPLLLFAAGHAKDDIPQAVEAALQEKGMLRRLCGIDGQANQRPHLGCHAKLLELSALRFDEAIVDRPQVAAETVLLMVGRGSRDAQATAEMLRFAQQRAAVVSAGQTRVGFIAMAEPAFEHSLNELSETNMRRIVVQPHLLFGGELLSRIGDLVSEVTSRHPEKEWIVTRHLGPHALLDDAVIDLVTSDLQSEPRLFE